MHYLDQGFVEFHGHRVWYGIVGDRTTSEMFPILTDSLQHAELQPVAARYGCALTRQECALRTLSVQFVF